MQDADIVILFEVVVGFLMIVGFFAIWNAAVQAREELQRVRRLLWISLSSQQPDFSLVGRKVWLPSQDVTKSRSAGSEFSLVLHGYESPCIAKEDVDAGKWVQIVGFRGDKLIVSKAEAKTAKAES